MFISQNQSISVFKFFNRSIAFSFLQVIAASFFILICSQIKIPLYFTPVPISAHTFAILLTGAMLGGRKGVYSVLLYLLEGSSLGILHIFSIYSGYYLGFIAQAYLAGWIIERITDFDSRKAMGFLLLACLLQMGLGAVWLANYVGANQALSMGVYPFLPGEIIKVLAVMSILKWKHRVYKRFV